MKFDNNGVDRRSVLQGGLGGAVALATGLGATSAHAKELQAGFVINKENFDSIKGDTFEGKTIASMVPEKLEWMIRNYNLTIKLANSKKIEMDPKYVQATKEWSKDVKFNPADRTVTGWKAGMLFPPDQIDPKDPNAGDKIIWNLRAATYGATMDLRDIANMDDGSYLGTLKAYETLEKTGCTIWLPGHGEPGAQVLQWNRELFEGIYRPCEQAIKDGLPLDAAKAQVLKDPRVASRAKDTKGFETNIGKYVSLAYLEAEAAGF